MDELKSALSSDPECGPNLALFLIWGKVRKTTVKPHPQHHVSEKMKQLKPVAGDNLEDLHRAELESQRVLLHQTLLNPVDTTATNTRNWNVNGLLHTPMQALPPKEPCNCRNDRMKMRSWALRQPALGCANRGVGTPPPAGSPSAVQERQATARPGGLKRKFLLKSSHIETQFLVVLRRPETSER